MGTESPYSNADSAVKSLEDGLTYFVKPFESVCVSFKEVVVCRPLFGVQIVLQGRNARISPRTATGIENLTLRWL